MSDGRSPGLVARVLGAAFLVAPLLHAVGRASVFDVLWIALALALPWIVAARSRPEERAGRVLVVAVAVGFASSSLPAVLGSAITGGFGFAYERAHFAAALAWLAWNGALTPRPARSRWPLRLRRVLLGWGAWSVGSAVHALVVNLPPDAPWVGESFAVVLLDPLGFPPLVDPAYPLARLWVRLEMLALALAALEVGLADPELPKRLARGFALALPAGVALNLVAIGLGYRGSEHSFAIRISSALDRVYRPLADHNALGSALVLMLLPTAWFAARSWLSRRPRGLSIGWTVCAASGALLLVGTSSKSALLGVAVATAVAGVLWILHAEGPLRRWLTRALIAMAVLVVLFQALPRDTAASLLETRYVRDVVRVGRLDFVTNYLRDNRFALWTSAGEMIAEAPVAGVGLGRFARELPEHHDPEAEGYFNPLQENAHNQYLQWTAEEGAVGALLGLLLIALGVGAGMRAVRQPPPLRPLAGVGGDAPADRLVWCALVASLVGLVVNLTVGHALLVPAVAGLTAVVVGLLVSAGGRSDEESGAPEAPPLDRAGASLALLLPLGCVPAFTAVRTPLEEHQVGCYPWLWQPFVEQGPEVSRLLTTDARWIQRWGAGSRMLVPAKTIVSSHLTESAQTVDAWVNGELVLEAYPLPFRAPDQPVNPVTYLKLDAPAGVEPGDLVEVRLVTTPGYSESHGGGHSQSIFGARVWPPAWTR